jgi:hypothetical protein
VAEKHHLADQTVRFLQGASPGAAAPLLDFSALCAHATEVRASASY